MRKEVGKPHLEKAVFVFTDGKTVEVTYEEYTRRLRTTGTGIIFGLLWVSMEAIAQDKRKRIQKIRRKRNAEKR